MGCMKKVARILVTGPAASGKTTLAAALAGHRLRGGYTPTNSPETFLWPEIRGTCVVVRVVATTVPGREEFSRLRMEVLRKVKFDAVLLVFDVSDPQSFYMLHSFINEVASTQECPVVLVGNKVDVGLGVPPRAHSTLALILSQRMRQKVIVVRPVSATTRDGLSELYSVLSKEILRSLRTPTRGSR